MDWSIWGTKLAGSLRSFAVRLAKLMISESGSARQVRQGNQSGDRATKQKASGGMKQDTKRRLVQAGHLAGSR